MLLYFCDGVHTDCKLFTGSFYYYIVLHMAVLWLCHVSVIFMKMQFPLHFRGFEKSKLIHLAVILVAVLLPCIPVIAAFSTEGFLTCTYPQVVCLMKNQDAHYYSFALVITVIICIGGPLLYISYLIIIKVISQI